MLRRLAKYVKVGDVLTPKPQSLLRGEFVVKEIINTDEAHTPLFVCDKADGNPGQFTYRHFKNEVTPK